MNCRLIDQHLLEYCSGNLSDSLNTEIRAHISACDSCRALYEFILLENEALRDSFVPPLADNFNAQVMARLRAEEAASGAAVKTPFWRRWSKYIVGLAVAAAVVALLPRFMPLAEYDALKPAAPRQQIMVAEEATAAADADAENRVEALDKDLYAGAAMDKAAEEGAVSAEHEPAPVPLPTPAPTLLATSDSRAVPYQKTSFSALAEGETDSAAARVYADGSEISRSGRIAEGKPPAVKVAPENLPDHYALAAVESSGLTGANYRYVNQLDQSQLCISISRDGAPAAGGGGNEKNARTEMPMAHDVPGISGSAAGTAESVREEEVAVVAVTGDTAEKAQDETTAGSMEAAMDAAMDAAMGAAMDAEADMDDASPEAPASAADHAIMNSAAALSEPEMPSSGDDTGAAGHTGAAGDTGAAAASVMDDTADEGVFNMIEIDYYGEDGVYQVSFHSNGSLNEILELAAEFSLTEIPEPAAAGE